MNASTIEIDIRVEHDGWREGGDDIESVCQSAVNAAARRTKTGPAGVDLLLTSNAEMRGLNAQWRGKDRPTDVLSFPAADIPAPDGRRFLGDIAMGLETCAGDADRLARPMAQHISHLAVHGFLHLLGYDHENSVDAAAMEALEVQILSDLGYPDPYEPTGPKPKSAHAR